MFLPDSNNSNERAISCESPMSVLVIGPGSQCAPIIKTIKDIEGLRLLGILDWKANQSTLLLTQELDISLWNNYAQVYPLQPDIILNLCPEEESKDYITRLRAEGTLVLDGTAVRLIRLLTNAYRNARTFESKYRVTKREYDLYAHRDELIIGKSKQIKMVNEMITQVAPMPTTVLLLGETGTGKDLVARSIHQASHLKDRPFITINCTALTPTLIESELFGYVKGAFTGAEHDCQGLLEEAHNGTVFLDEIGDMKMELQAKMLRFLQSGEIRLVGSSHIKTVNVRVIAATNKDLEVAIRKGEFRQDLFYRFNTFTIVLPKLRDRIEDIPYLTYHFLTKAEDKLNKKIEGISDEALETLMNYHWPGNVRELENIVERAVIVCSNGIILPEHLAIPASGNLLKTFSLQPKNQSKNLKTSRDRFLADYEKQEILYSLRKTGGNVSQASRLSNIPRRTFYRLMKKHGIRRPVPDRTQ